MRRQLPAYSPITLGGIARGMAHVARLGADPRPRLAARLCREYTADAARLYGSGTQALRAALELVFTRRHPLRVVLPVFTCFDVGAAAVAAGAQIDFYDVDPETLGPDLDSLRAALHRGAQAVVVTPLYGYPVDWDAIASEAAHAGAVLIEDAAQGHGASWRGRPLGSWGPLAVLSFGRGKGWTGGAGGALLLRGEWAVEAGDAAAPAGWATECRVLAQLAAQWALGRPALYALPAAIPWLGLGETSYRDAPLPRFLGRGAAGSLEVHRQLSEREGAARRAGARLLLEGLAGSRTVRPVRALAAATPGYLRLPVRLAGGLSGLSDPRRALRLGVAPSYPSTLKAVPEVHGSIVSLEGQWRGGEELAQTLVTLPTHSLAADRERREIIALVGGREA
jgi:hypothetical protein